jgi:hypothetical protein
MIQLEVALLIQNNSAIDVYMNNTQGNHHVNVFGPMNNLEWRGCKWVLC